MLPAPKHHNLGDSLAIVGLAVAVITWALAPNFFAKSIAVLFGTGLLVYLSYKSHFVRSFPEGCKHMAAVATFLAVLTVALLQLIPQWKEEHYKPSNGGNIAKQDQTQTPTPLPSQSPNRMPHPTAGNPNQVQAQALPITPTDKSHPDAKGQGVLGFPNDSFRQNIDTITVLFGNSTYEFAVSELMKGPRIIDDDSDFEISLKDDAIHYQIRLLGPHGIQIVDNRFSGLHQLWDSNSSTTAFEIVNELHSPIFQFIRESDSQIAVYGAFQGRNGVTFMTKGPTIPSVKNFNYHSDTVPGLKAIFKYPSWKYPGQYADE
jgi:hypothetical protein